MAAVSLINNSEPDDCPIESCELKEPDCSKQYAGEDLTIDAKDNFMISFKETNKAGGQLIDICIKCKNVL